MTHTIQLAFAFIVHRPSVCTSNTCVFAHGSWTRTCMRGVRMRTCTHAYVQVCDVGIRNAPCTWTRIPCDIPKGLFSGRATNWIIEADTQNRPRRHLKLVSQSGGWPLIYQTMHITEAEKRDGLVLRLKRGDKLSRGSEREWKRAKESETGIVILGSTHLCARLLPLHR